MLCLTYYVHGVCVCVCVWGGWVGWVRACVRARAYRLYEPGGAKNE